MDPTRPDPRLLPALAENHLPAVFHGNPLAAAHDDAEGELSLKELWRVIMRRKWAVISTFLIIVIATAIGTAQITPIYRGTVTVQIDKQAQRIVNFEDRDPSSYDYDYNNSYINTYIEVLKSRALAERVVAQMGLRETEDSAAARQKQGIMDWLQGWLGDGKKPQAAPKAPADAQRDGAVGALMGGLLVEPVRNSRIVRVSFDSANPEVAARVANQVAQTFIELNLERRMDASSYAKTFLEERLEQMRARLEDSEKKLVGFARKQEIVAINEKQNLNTAKLDQVQQELAKVQLDHVRLEAQYQALQDSKAPTPQILANPVIQELKKNKTALEVQYQEQLKIYKPAFPKMQQLQAQIDELQTRIDAEVATMRASAKTELDATVSRENMLQSLLGQAKGEVLTGQDKSIEYNILKREVDTNRNLYDGLLQRLKEVGVAGGIETNNISVVDKADVPDAPYKPNMRRNLMLGAFVGLLLGVLLAFAFEHFDDTFRDPEDIERTLGLAVLGVVPVPDHEISSAPNGLAMASVGAPRSMFAEAYRSMRTALQFSTGEGAPKVVAITSAVPGEGKTTSAINLATAFASTGSSVLLIDADLRNPSLHKKLGLETAAGLSNYLVGQLGPIDITRAGPVPNLFVIPAGHLPPNPAELLGGPRMAELIKTARQRFQHVVIDSPPVLSIADGLVISSFVDATVLAVAADSTRKNVARDALKRLRHVRAHVIGGVLTKYNARGRANSYYHYYYYGDQNAQRLPAA
ncbi:MAG: polysaccharide biosynthesis tyrosine autokinase [Proteobacteria bacterium]|nr:polysaccharide biosynthesis tyrosine autokinase [Pseudomonadota bacterium]